MPDVPDSMRLPLEHPLRVASLIYARRFAVVIAVGFGSLLLLAVALFGDEYLQFIHFPGARITIIYVVVFLTGYSIRRAVLRRAYHREVALLRSVLSSLELASPEADNDAYEEYQELLRRFPEPSKQKPQERFHKEADLWGRVGSRWSRTVSRLKLKQRAEREEVARLHAAIMHLIDLGESSTLHEERDTKADNPFAE